MRRIPVKDIQFNTTTTTTQPTATQPTTSQPKTSHVSVAARAIISTIAALVLIGAVILVFIWYRRRYNTIGGSSVFSSGVMEAASGSRVEVTPFVSSHEMTHGGPMTRTGWDQPQSGLSATAVTYADAHDPYSAPSGLHPQPPGSVPVGLSDKGLARIRAENLRSEPAIHTITVALPGDASRSQSPSIPATPTEQRGPPTSQPLFRTLQSQVDRLWREMRQLRAERLGSEAPPSYAENDVSHHDGGLQS